MGLGKGLMKSGDGNAVGKIVRNIKWGYEELGIRTLIEVRILMGILLK